MTQQILNNLETMGVARGKINDNFTDLYIRSKGNMYNTDTLIATLVDAATWYPMISVDLSANNLQDFTFNNGEFTYTGDSGKSFNFSAHATIEVDKACLMDFALFVNETMVTGATSPVELTASDKKSNIGISTILTLDTNDKVTVRARTSVANTGLTTFSVNNVLWS